VVSASTQTVNRSTGCWRSTSIAKGWLEELIKAFPLLVRRRALRASNKTFTPAACVRSLQRRVLRLGFLQDGDVGVGVFPEGEEILVGEFGFRRVTREGIRAGESEVRQRA
jgi:hypothetical protein